jgi:hypothetical protein
MKIDLAVITAMFEQLFEQGGGWRSGALPYRTMERQWAGVRLRESDLALAIEHLRRQGRLRLESRRGDVWLHRCDRAEPVPEFSAQVRRRWRKLMVGLAMEQVRERRDTFYAGMERRRRSAGP